MKNLRLIGRVLLHLLAFVVMCAIIVGLMSTSIDLRNQADTITVALGWALFALTLAFIVGFAFLVARTLVKVVKHFDTDFNQNI